MIFKDEEKFKDKIGIYGIKNIINNNIYVGKTKASFKQRFKAHNRELTKGIHYNTYLQKSWNKYGGENFVFFVIDVVRDNKYLNYLEKYYIRYYKCRTNCFNMTDGGDGGLGCVPSKKTRYKMSKSRFGKYIKRKTDIINKEIAKEIKERLVKGEKPGQIVKDLNIDYRHINNIISNNTWHYVHVEGWDEWRFSRRTWTRLTKKDHEEIYFLNLNEGYNKYKLAKLYNKGVKMIEKILRDQRKLHGNPVPSQ